MALAPLAGRPVVVTPVAGLNNQVPSLSGLVGVDEPPAAPTMRGLGKDRCSLVEKGDKTFEDATAAVTPAARSLIARLRSIDNPPDEVGIQFGVQLSAQTGAFIASVAAEANFTVSMTWRRHHGAGG